MSLPSEQNWLVLHHLLIDLTKKGYEIPAGINSEMGIIRSSISSYKRDPTHPELINTLANAEMSLSHIQSTLLSIAEEEGEDYADEWLDLLKLLHLHILFFLSNKLEHNNFHLYATLNNQI